MTGAIYLYVIDEKTEAPLAPPEDVQILDEESDGFSFDWGTEPDMIVDPSDRRTRFVQVAANAPFAVAFCKANQEPEDVVPNIQPFVMNGGVGDLWLQLRPGISRIFFKGLP